MWALHCSGSLFWESSKTAGQEVLGIQMGPGTLLELKSGSWQPGQTKASRVGRAVCARGESYKRNEFQMSAEGLPPGPNRALISECMWGWGEKQRKGLAETLPGADTEARTIPVPSASLGNLLLLRALGEYSQGLVSAVGIINLRLNTGLPWWPRGKVPTCQCRSCGFDPGVGKIP